MKRFFLPVIIAAIISGILMLISALEPGSGLRAKGRLQGEIDDYKARNAVLEKENAALEREIAALSEDETVFERNARESLSLVRPDEVVFNFEEK